jgi:hypothetical protein
MKVERAGVYPDEILPMIRAGDSVNPVTGNPILRVESEDGRYVVVEFTCERAIDSIIRVAERCRQSLLGLGLTDE